MFITIDYVRLRVLLITVTFLIGLAACSNQEAGDEDSTSSVSILDVAHKQSVCASKGAQCGTVRDSLDNSFSCGACYSGETCSNNRCEASCHLEQIDNGPFNDLFAYIPTQFSYEDQSKNKFTANMEMLPHEKEELFVFESSVDMSDKKLTVDFGNKSLAKPYTLSFKVMSSESHQNAVLIGSNALTVEEVGGSLAVELLTNVRPVSIVNSQSEINSHSCSHVAIRVDESNVATYLNGNRVDVTTDTSSLKTLSGTLTVGPYPGKVWDIRLFESALDENQVTELGEECNENKSWDTGIAEYPNYLCGVYQCMLIPSELTDTTQESLEYQLSGHDMTWEYNVMDSGMYAHGELCAEYEKPRNLELSVGYRNAWVNSYSFENPWNQYVLHENFHFYQTRTGGNTKWLDESTASWGAFSMKPTAHDSLLGMYTLQPHLALWTTQSSEFEEGIIDYSKGGHQYGAGIFWWYVSHYVLDDDAIGRVYNRHRLNLAPLTHSPQEAIYNLMAERGFDMREVFSDFAARITTWDVDYGDTFLESEKGSFDRMSRNNINSDNPIPDSEVNNKIAQFYDVNATNGQWVEVPSRYKIGDWAFNAYEVDVTSSTTYTVGINPSIDNPDYSEFRAQIVVYNEESGQRIYHKLPVTSAGIPATMNVHADSGDKLYLVVSNTPSTKFSDFEAYTYDYLIEAN